MRTQHAAVTSDYLMAALWAQSKLDVVGVGEPIGPGRAPTVLRRQSSAELGIQKVDVAATEPRHRPRSRPATRAWPVAGRSGYRQRMPALSGGIRWNRSGLYQVG